ncbi:DUF305 domain-containing protein [Streptomyces populi]|uniref:DUF305 domain-containing protein n=1 Tax=Streptomyces populi TaxID=2058924 RepID=A0A2I0STC4_9ACTN|nr:DUF305 domain-containing protein [Streptomyces populi]PKT73187.1 DUF305 domain-containing protein [Streptomyces populi]
MSRSRAPLATAAALLVLALAGCDADTGDRSADGGGPSVIVPGAPGEGNRTLSADEAAAQRAEDDSPNAADVSYARMMIQHHAQALEMTGLVPGRARSGDLKRLALRISAAQRPEIEAMRGWLKTHGKTETGDAGDHRHAGMPGMATETQMEELRAARGADFDALFLTLMITHHEGAVAMATDVKAQGNNLLIEEMADDVVAQQTSEITRMRGMR